MATRIPGGAGVWLDPADLGFNALVIAGAANANGLVIPWAASYRFRRINFWLRLTGPASSVSLRLNQELDFNGTTVLRSGISAIWTTVTTGVMCMSAGALSTTIASVGAVLANPLASVWGAPYLQFNVLNNDGVNAATVSLSVGLFE